MARILVMEDDTPLGLELLAVLRTAGHEPVLTGSAQESKDALWHWDYDLLITDMIVRQDGRAKPGGGLDLIGWVRQTRLANPVLRHLPIIAVSGETSRRGMQFLLPTAERIGADVVLEKPVDMVVLLAEIDRLILAPPSGELD